MFHVDVGTALVAVALVIAARWLYLAVICCWRGYRATVIHHPDSTLGRRVAQGCSTLREKYVTSIYYTGIYYISHPYTETDKDRRCERLQSHGDVRTSNRKTNANESCSIGTESQHFFRCRISFFGGLRGGKEAMCCHHNLVCIFCHFPRLYVWNVQQLCRE